MTQDIHDYYAEKFKRLSQCTQTALDNIEKAVQCEINIIRELEDEIQTNSKFKWRNDGDGRAFLQFVPHKAHYGNFFNSS